MKRIAAWLLCLGIAVMISGAATGQKAPLNLSIVWHQHQPMYWNRLTGAYELPWVRVHGVQEYIDSPRISAEYPSVHVTFNLQPSLLWQLADYASITPEEEALGGLYAHIGAVDNHLQWTWALAQGSSDLSQEDRADLQEQSFWLNGYMFDDDADDPYYDLRYDELNTLKNTRDLTDAELLDAAGLFLLWQISPELHETYGLEALRGKSGFGLDDIVQLIEAQMAILQDVVAAYANAAKIGNELITSPFYHPILPLLMERGWREDALGQIAAAQAQHTQLFGAPSAGVWPPEQAVSEDAVSLLSEAGFIWTTTDEGLLALALAHTPSTEELTTAWTWNGITVLFRETTLSNNISFAYGNKAVDAAVDDFMQHLEQVWVELDDPAGHLLTLAMDGENWMFLAGYANNGRTFLRTLYEALAQAGWVRTVTPAEALAGGLVTAELPTVPTGSWAGDLATWIGEPDEDAGWERLADARRTVAAAGDPPNAVEAIYAAQGSDWFWWYGTDQDSGTDDLFDWLFKAHLVGAYTLSGEDSPPPVLGLRLTPPRLESLGSVEPVLDGATTDEEGWADAVYFEGSGELREARIAYKESLLVASVTLSTPPATWIGQDVYLVLYASGAPGVAANVATRHADAQLGFELASAIQVNFSKLSADGSGVVSKYAANGQGGWRYASSIQTTLNRTVQASTTIEFSIPFSEAGIEPGKSLTLSLVLERAGEMIDILPAQPVLAQIPTLIQGEERASLDDPTGDDHGTGTFVYPTNAVFATEGLFDLLAYRVYDADDRWQLAFDFAALPNPWGGPQGFSHPLLYLYFDVAEGGRTTSHEEGEAAHVRFDSSHPWDVFIRIAGWPAYGRHLWTASGEGPFLVEAASDPKRGRIIVTIPKSLMPEIRGSHYVLVASQDGYGGNFLRAIGESPGEWTGGGSPDPFWAPALYDILAPAGRSQEEILGSYSAAQQRYATLLPVSIEFDIP